MGWERGIRERCCGGSRNNHIGTWIEQNQPTTVCSDIGEAADRASEDELNVTLLEPVRVPVAGVTAVNVADPIR